MLFEVDRFIRNAMLLQIAWRCTDHTSFRRQAPYTQSAIGDRTKSQRNINSFSRSMFYAVNEQEPFVSQAYRSGRAVKQHDAVMGF